MTERRENRKKEYHKPVLVVYGTVRELTQQVGPHGNPDGGTFGTLRVATHA